MAEEPLTVSDIMTTNVITIGPDDSVYEAARRMKSGGIGSLVVVDKDGSLVGIITVRDIVYRVVAEGKDPARIKVAEVMSKNPYYVLDDDSVERAVDIMGTTGVGHLPVLDHETFKVVGIISKRDIVREAPHLLGRLYRPSVQV